MKTLHRNSTSGVGFLDILYILILVAFWFVMSLSWKDAAAAVMFTSTVLVAAFYMIFLYAGSFPFLSLSRPYWTISGLISVPIWYLLFIALPTPNGNFTATNVVPNLAETFFDKNGLLVSLQVYGFPSTESLLAAIFVAVMIGVGAGIANNKVKRNSVFLVGIMIAVIMALGHITVVANLSEAGVYSSGVLFAHQFLTFGILIFGSLLFPMAGAVFLVAAHMSKNLLVYASPTAFYVVFGFFIVMDLLAIFFAPKKTAQSTSSSISKFMP